MSLIISAADTGTFCNTILTQMPAEFMKCVLKQVTVFVAGIDASPHGSCSFASSMTSITDKAIETATKKLKNMISKIAYGILDCTAEELKFESD
ncbi:MAG: molybdopterin-dependent oxidoreductase [Eggerthellaceae bacterium]|nr:molybdopterin-dependent oxidoreductase [Eggerthellaceae bacterium]